MSSFCISTQREDWLMEPEDLVYLRARSMSQINDSKQRSNKDSITVRGLPKENEEDQELIISNQTKNILEQEEVFLTRYCRNIQRYFGEETKEEKSSGKKRIIGAISYWRVSATAIVYFRRFYLNNNLIAFDPRVIMLTCVFLAGKVEESPVRMQSLLSVYPECDKDTITSHELILIEGLNYHLKIFHSRNVMHTVITDFRHWSEELQKQEQKQQQHSEVQKTPKLVDNNNSHINKVDDSPNKKDIQSTKRIRTDDNSNSNSNSGNNNSNITPIAVATSEASIIDGKTSTPVSASDTVTPLNSSRMNVEKDDIIHNSTTIKSSSSSSPSLTTIAMVTETSEMRKQWRELAETLVESFQNSIATLCYTPAEVAICSLKLSLQDPSISSVYPHIHNKYEQYLRERYGIAVASELDRILPNLEDLLVYENEAERDDESFNAVKCKLNIS